MGDEMYLQRCFDLARLGLGRVSPNPAVGAVLVYNERIIGEGYHPYFGGPHAEVMAVRSVAPELRELIPHATLYVSLEPCCIYGKTPPCTNLILAEGIKRVVVAQRDQTPEVHGRGLAILRDAGIDVLEYPHLEDGRRLALPRNVLVSKQRPYVLLKYALSANGYLAPANRQPYWLTNPFSRRWVHQWRTQTDAILVGAGTALADNPSLTARMYPGRSPVRMVLERQRLLPAGLQLFQPDAPTWLFSQQALTRPALGEHVRVIPFDFSSADWPGRLLSWLYDQKTIGHLTVEGGAQVLDEFVRQALWDEARVLTTPVHLPDGIVAPTLPTKPVATLGMAGDRLDWYFRD